MGYNRSRKRNFRAAAKIPQKIKERGLSMAKNNAVLTDAVPLAVPYRRKIGKTTFVVSAFGNPKSADTAQRMILRLLTEQAAQDSETPMRRCA